MAGSMRQYGPPKPRKVSYSDSIGYPEEDDFDFDDLPDLPESEADRAARKAEEEREVERLTGEIKDLEERIADRRRYGATDESLADDLGRLGALRDSLESIEVEAEYADERQLELQTEYATTPKPPPRPGPWQAYQAALRAELTTDELRHWQAYSAGTDQAGIVRMLGITQGAVSKREAKLKAKVAAIHMHHFGRPPARTVTAARRQGVRGRARNIPPAP